MNIVPSNLNALTAEFKAAMEALDGDRLAEVILYGSYARSDFHTDSDVDIMIILKDEKISKSQEIQRIAPTVSSIGFKYFMALSPIVVPENRYMQSDYLFFRNVRREGVPI